MVQKKDRKFAPEVVQSKEMGGCTENGAIAPEMTATCPR
jgi:hypothetical protein